MIGTALLQVPSVAAVIRDEAGRVLLQRRASDGAWSLPAGAIDPAESPAEAVVREVLEETGLAVVPDAVLGVFGGERYRHTYAGGDRVEYLVVVFACSVTGDLPVEGVPAGHDGETLELRWFAPEAMPPLALPYPPELFSARPGERGLFEVHAE